jgi:hypothetical protein
LKISVFQARSDPPQYAIKERFDPAREGFKYEWEVNLRLEKDVVKTRRDHPSHIDPGCPRKLGTRTIKLSEDDQIRRTASRANAEAKTGTNGSILTLIS